MNLPNRPAGSNTVNPFIMADRTEDLIAFLIDVFQAEDVPEARTLDTDGLIMHAELKVGDSLLTLADRKPDWPFTPAFTRVYVHDVEATLERAVRGGATVVTKPTDFFGDTLARFADPSGNLWWVYRHDPTAADSWTTGNDEDAGWSAGADAGGDAADEDWSSFSSPELEYIHSTLMDAMGSLRDPRG